MIIEVLDKTITLVDALFPKSMSEKTFSNMLSAAKDEIVVSAECRFIGRVHELEKRIDELEKRIFLLEIKTPSQPKIVWNTLSVGNDISDVM